VPGVLYISSSKSAILGMASRLGGFEALSEDPLVEVDVEKEKGTLEIKPMKQEIEECIVLEEDPEMYAMAAALSLCLCLRLCLCRLGLSQPSGRPWLLCLL
jgi:hypothetical protein